MNPHTPYPTRFFPFFGGPLVGGFLGGLLGSALVLRPRPFYPYPPAAPPVPYAAYPQYGGGYPPYGAFGGGRPPYGY